MPGPHDANGIKLLATSLYEFPRVEEIGIAIPTGAHAFVGLGVLVVCNLYIDKIYKYYSQTCE